MRIVIDDKDKDASASVNYKIIPSPSTASFDSEIPAKDLPTSEDRPSYRPNSLSIFDKNQSLSHGTSILSAFLLNDGGSLSYVSALLEFLDQESSTFTSRSISTPATSIVANESVTVTAVPSISYRDDLPTSSRTTFPIQGSDKDSRTSFKTQSLEISAKGRKSAATTFLAASTGLVNGKAPFQSSVATLSLITHSYLAVKDNETISVESFKSLETAVLIVNKSNLTSYDYRNNQIGIRPTNGLVAATFSGHDTLSHNITSVKYVKTNTQLSSTTVAATTLDEDKASLTLISATSGKVTGTKLLNFTRYSVPSNDKTISAFSLEKGSTIITDSTLNFSTLPVKDRNTSTLQPPYISSLSRGSSVPTTYQALSSATFPHPTSLSAKSSRSFALEKIQTSTPLRPLPTSVSKNAGIASPSASVNTSVNSIVLTTLTYVKDHHNSISTSLNATDSALHTSKPITIPTPVLDSSSNAFQGTPKSLAKGRELSSIRKPNLSASTLPSESKSIGYVSKLYTTPHSPLQTALRSELAAKTGLNSVLSEATLNDRVRDSVSFGSSSAFSVVKAPESTKMAAISRSPSSASEVALKTPIYPSKRLGSSSKAPFLNRTSTVVPIWSPSMLGNAYGGGFVTTPSVFKTLFPSSSTSITSANAIPSKHGFASTSELENYQLISHGFTSAVASLKDTSSTVPTPNTSSRTKVEAGSIEATTLSFLLSLNDHSGRQKKTTTPSPTIVLQASYKSTIKNGSKLSPSPSSTSIPIIIGSNPSPGFTNTGNQESAGAPSSASREKSLFYYKSYETPSLVQVPGSYGLPSTPLQVAKFDTTNLATFPEATTVTTQVTKSSDLPSTPLQIAKVDTTTLATFPEATTLTTRLAKSADLPLTPLQIKEVDSTDLATFPQATVTTQLASSVLSSFSSSFGKSNANIPVTYLEATFTTRLPASYGLASGSSLTEQNNISPTNSPEVLVIPESPKPSEVSQISYQTGVTNTASPTQSPQLFAYSLYKPDQSVTPGAPTIELAKYESYIPTNSPQTLIATQSLRSSAILPASPLESTLSEQATHIIPGAVKTASSTDNTQNLATPPQILATIQPAPTAAFSSATLLTGQGILTGLATSGSSLSGDKSYIPSSLIESSTQLSVPSKYRNWNSAGPGINSSGLLKYESLSSTKSSAAIKADTPEETSTLGPSATSNIGKSTILYSQSKDTASSSLTTDVSVTLLSPSTSNVAASYPTNLYTSSRGANGTRYTLESPLAFQGSGPKQKIGTTFGLIAISIICSLF